MFWRRRQKTKQPKDSILSCPSCKIDLEIPTKVIRDFSPGGKEHHPGGTGSIMCPNCGGLIELK